MPESHLPALGPRRLFRAWLLFRAPFRRAWSRVEYRRERARGGLPDYPHEVLFIAGLPKSGTNWIAQLLEGVPGYRQRVIRDPDRCMRRHDICQRAIRSQPSGLYSVMRTHTRWSPENVAVIREQGLKTLVMHRDLRDQAVSRMYHVLNDPRHRHYELYRSLSVEDALTHSIDITLEYYVPWVVDWLEQVRRDPGNFLELRYESLHADPVAALTGVLRLYEIPLSQAEIEAIVERVRARTRFGLSDGRLLVAGGGTARKGGIGDWRSHFNPDHVERFKRGAGELLIELGQEPDMSWTGEAAATQAPVAPRG